MEEFVYLTIFFMVFMVSFFKGLKCGIFFESIARRKQLLKGSPNKGFFICALSLIADTPNMWKVFCPH